MDSYDILVVMLSVTLAVFLLLGIIFMIYLIKIARRVHEIAEKARSAADTMESAAKFFEKTAGPAAFTRVIANIVESFHKRQKGKK